MLLLALLSQVGTIEEEVVAVKEEGTYNLGGNLSFWAWGTDSLSGEMGRAKLDFDLTFGSWLSGFVSLEHWGSFSGGVDLREAYLEGYFGLLSVRAGKQLLFYGEGTLFSDRIGGYPAVSALLGDKVWLNVHGIYLEGWQLGADAGLSVGPLSVELTGLKVSDSSWAGARAEVETGLLSAAAEASAELSDSAALCALAHLALERWPFSLGGGYLLIDSAYSKPFPEGPTYADGANGWWGFGDAFTFSYLRNPFWLGVSGVQAGFGWASYSRYLDFIKPDLVLTVRLDGFYFQKPVDAPEVDLSVILEELKVVKGGITGGFLASDPSFYSVRAWVQKSFYFGE